jgi:hypothetical protein
MVLIKLLKGTAVGLAAHQSNRVIEEWEGRVNPPWTRLARYTVGFLSALPVGVLMFRHLYRSDMTADEAADTFTVATLAAGVSYGVGVAVGYLIDGLLERLK